jgi:hypothetical protein
MGSADTDVREEMDLVKSQGKWPVRYRIEKFTGGIFARVRLSSSPDFCHEIVRNVDGKNNGRNCALCSSGNQKRTSMFWCSICEVHLCITSITFNARKTCNQQWHNLKDLKREATVRNRQVEALQVVKKNLNKSRERQNIGTEDGTDAMVNDENTIPLAENIPPRRLAESIPPRRLAESIPPRRLAENIPPRRLAPRRSQPRVAESIPPTRLATRRSKRTATSAFLSSELELEIGAEILSSVRGSSSREMFDI